MNQNPKDLKENVHTNLTNIFRKIDIKKKKKNPQKQLITQFNLQLKREEKTERNELLADTHSLGAYLCG